MNSDEQGPVIFSRKQSKGTRRRVEYTESVLLAHLKDPVLLKAFIGKVGTK